MDTRYKDVEKRREYLRQWRRAHRKQLTEANRRWLQNNPDKAEEYRIKKRAYAKHYRATHPKQIKTPEQYEHWLQYQKDRLGQRRAFVDNYKLERGCKLCGYNTQAVALDFHHNGDKTKIVSVLKHGTMEKPLAEMEHCDVVCANCHRVLHNSVDRGDTML